MEQEKKQAVALMRYSAIAPLITGTQEDYDPVFDDAAIEAILNASDGTARVISKLCNASLVIGHSQTANRITADIVMQAINDSTLG